MVKVAFDIVGGSNYGVSNMVDNQRTINMYVHKDGVAKNKVLLPNSGLTLVATSKGVGSCRLLFTPTVVGTQAEPIMFSIMGNEAYAYDSLLVERKLATLSTGLGYIGVAANNAGQLLFVDGVDGYLYDINAETWTVASTFPNFPEDPIDVTFLDGYFIVATASSDPATANEFFLSGDQGQFLNDGTKWNPLDAEQFTTQPDTLIACRTSGVNLFLFGKQFTAIWNNTDSLEAVVEFPFAPNRSYALVVGCDAPATIKQITIKRGTNYILWLGRDGNGIGNVMLSDGGRPISVDTRAISSLLENYSEEETAAATAGIREERGHGLYTLNLPDTTLVYDIQENTWTEQQEQDGQRHIAESSTYFLKKHLVGDYRNTNIYAIDKDNYTYNNVEIKRTRICREFAAEKEVKIRVNALELDLKSALGKNDGLDVNPEVYLSFSKDKGITYSRRVGARVGKQGETRHRTMWYNLGTGYSFYFKLEYIQGNEFTLHNATIDYDILEH